MGIYLAFWVTFSNFSIISGHFGGLADLPKMADFSVFHFFSVIIWSFDLVLGSYTTIGLKFHKKHLFGYSYAFLCILGHIFDVFDTLLADHSQALIRPGIAILAILAVKEASRGLYPQDIF